MDKLDLTENIRIDTGIPFPIDTNAIQLPGSHPSDTTKKKTIIAEVCSEYTDYRAQVEYFKKSSHLRLVHDKDYKPIVFTLDENSTLCALRHGTHNGEGWLCTNVGPVDRKVTSFDVVQIQNILYVAAACKKPQQQSDIHELHYCSVDLSPSDFAFEPEAQPEEKLKKGMGWVLAPNNASPKDRVGDLAISAVSCRVLMDENNAVKDFDIIVATAAHGDRIATHYQVRTRATDGRLWNPSTFPTYATRLLQVEPLILGDPEYREGGLVSMCEGYAAGGGRTCIGQRSDARGGFYSDFEYQTLELGGVQSFFSHLNPFGTTDVFIAGENGIGFYSAQLVDTMSAEPILPQFKFKQVVVSEDEVPGNVFEYKISIFAVRDNGYLYFIEGTRTIDKDTYEASYQFEASGMPIREGVTHLATQFNTSHGTNELLYASEHDNALFYLRRLPSGRSWIEDKITRKASNYIKFDAFVSTIILTDGSGVPLPTEHSVSVTGDSLHVVANGKACTLSQQPESVAPDSTGSVLIVVPSDRKTSLPPLTVTIEEKPVEGSMPKTYSINVNSAKRVERLLSGYNSVDNLRKARSSTGEPLLKDLPPEKLDEAASLLGEYNTAKRSLQENTTSDSQSEEPEEGDESWFGQAVDSAEKFLGDVIETIKKGLKTVFKVAIRVWGPVVKFYLKIQGTIFKWVLKFAWNLLECIGSGLESLFGYDGFSKLLKCLKLALDPAAIAKTQKFLMDTVTGSIKLASRVVVHTKDSILAAVDDAAEVVKGFIDDPRAPPRNDPPPDWIMKIFNNPFTRLLSKINPLSWMIEAIMEEIPDLKIPDMGRLFGTLHNMLGTVIEQRLSGLQRLWDTFFNQVQRVGSDPSQIVAAITDILKSIFWDLWDAAKSLIEAALNALHLFLDELVPVLTETWKIPGLTDIWEDVTGQEFSLLRFFTFLPAVIINLCFLAADGELPNLPTLDLDRLMATPLDESTSKRRKTEHLQSNAIVEFDFQGNSANNSYLDSITPAANKAIAMNTTKVAPKYQAANQSLWSAEATISMFTSDKQSTAPSQAADAPTQATDSPKEWKLLAEIELFTEDLGKLISGVTDMIESGTSAVADIKFACARPKNEKDQMLELTLMDPQHKGRKLGDPKVRQTTNEKLARGRNQPAKSLDRIMELLRTWEFWKKAGRILQSVGLLLNNIVIVSNLFREVSISTATTVSGICGVVELSLVVFSMSEVGQEWGPENVLVWLADVLSFAAMVGRIGLDKKWNLSSLNNEEWWEFKNSVSTMGKNLLEVTKEICKAEPNMKAILSGAICAGAGFGMVTAAAGFYYCVQRL